jgi:predicted MFS family arabinose efflux permease
VAALALAGATGLLVTTLRPAGALPRAAAKGSTGYRAALTPPVLRLLAMGVAERVCYGIAAVYYATFLQASYGLSLEAVAIPLAIFALGNILGTLLGGQLADRLPDRRLVYAGAMACSAGVAFPLFGWAGGLAPSVALGFAYVFVTAVARPSLMAALANVPEEVRGTVLGLNVTSASFGWLGAAALGGWMMVQFGFWGFAPLAAGMALLGAALAVTGRRPGR